MSRSHPERLTVIHVLAPGDVGGLESVVRLMSAGQRRRGHDVLVVPIVPRAAVCPAWVSALRSGGVAVEPLVAPHRHYRAQWKALVDLCRARRPSVLHTHGYHADLVGRLAARRAGVPVVTTVHGFVGGDWKNRLYEWLQQRAFRTFDAIMVVSRAMAAELVRSGVPDQRIHVVPNAFETAAEILSRAGARQMLGLDDSGFHVGWIGRLSPEKGADVMLRALAMLEEADVRLSMVGDGAERGRLEALAGRLRIAGRVIWHGVEPEAGRLASAFDVIVLSSRSEGTPMVLFEAMAAGTPVVATGVGGVPDVLTNSEGILVPPENPASLAAAVRAIRAEPQGAAERAVAARRRIAEHFAVEPWLALVDDVYAAAIRGHGARRRG